MFAAYAVQVAAVLGLEKTGSKRAVLALTERVLEDGDLWPTERAIEALSTLTRNGGLLALTATFLTDSRFVHRKLTLLYEGAKKLRRQDVAESLEAIYQHAGTKYEPRELIPEVLTMLERIPLADVSTGATLTRLFLPITAWAGAVYAPDDARAERAIAYSNLRLPRLVEILTAYHYSGA